MLLKVHTQGILTRLSTCTRYVLHGTNISSVLMAIIHLTQRGQASVTLRPDSGLFRLHKPVTDWLEMLPHSVYGLNM